MAWLHETQYGEVERITLLTAHVPAAMIDAAQETLTCSNTLIQSWKWRRNLEQCDAVLETVCS